MKNMDKPKIKGSKKEFEAVLLERINKGNLMLQNDYSDPEQLKLLDKEYQLWDDFNKELIKKYIVPRENEYSDKYLNVSPSYKTVSDAMKMAQLHMGPNALGTKNEIRDRVAILERLINILDFLEQENSQDIIDQPNQDVMNNKIFIVHGHDEAVRLHVTRTIEQLGLEPIVLHEQANSGLTIIEKFETNSDVGFAIILLTPDDVGNVKTSTDMNPRARQNVIFEMGYFVAKLGRNKVFNLYSEGVELPSDLSGILYTPYDSSKGWQLKLVRELKQAGYNIDANNLA